MKYFNRRLVLFSAGVCFLALLLVTRGWTQQTASDPPSDADPLAVPEGTADELIAFIEKVAGTSPQFNSRAEMVDYAKKASAAIGTAAERILAGKTNDQQAIDAVEWKVESLRVRESIGDVTAATERDEFLESRADDKRPAVAKAIARAKFSSQLEPDNWRMLSEDEQAATVNDFVQSVKNGKAVWQDASVARYLSMIADQGDTELAVHALKELLPKFREVSSLQMMQLLPELEGTVRLLSLLGNKMELEGMLLDGTPLDWESYRGKVVLVDFWATWCGPCRAEVPNVLAEYRGYHDKGFDVLGISLDQTREQAESYIEQTGIPWASVFSDDPNATGWEAPMATKYAITAIPRAILVDQDGVVVHMNARGENLTEQLELLLGEPIAQQPVSEASLEGRTVQNSDGAVR